MTKTEKESLTKAIILHKKASNCYKQRHFDSALNFILLEQNAYKNKNNTKYFKTIYSLAKIYYKTKEYKKSIKEYKKYLRLKYFKGKKNKKTLKRLSKLYKLEGDIKESIFYRKELIKLLEKGKDTQDLFNQYINLLVLYDDFNDKSILTNQIKTLNKAAIILGKSPNFTRENYYNLNINYALYYLKDSVNNLSKAKQYYLKNLHLAEKKKDFHIISTMLNNIGELYIRKKNDSAKYFLKKALAINKYNFELITFNLSNYYKIKGNLYKSISYIQKSINYTTNTKYTYNEIIPKKKYLRTKNTAFLVSILELKTSILLDLYKSSKDIKYIHLALNTINIVDKIVTHISKQVHKKSKMYWQNKISKIYFYGFYCSRIINNPNKAFYFSEKSKALLLIYENIEKKLHSELPEAVDQKILNYRQNIDTIKESKKLKLKLKYDAYIDSIEKKYPNYSKHKKIINPNIINLKKVQKELKKEDVIISFVWNNEFNKELAYLIISKHNIKFIEIDDPNFFLLLKKYKKMVSTPIQTKYIQKKFSVISNKIYTHLFPTKELQNFITSSKNIKIIADGPLVNMPFESLITNKDKFLIFDSSINYIYSYTYFTSSKDMYRKPTKKMLTISPVYFEQSNLPTLLNSEREIANIGEIIDFDSFKQDKATKSNFLKNCKDYNIIHLATHAVVKKELPKIFFKRKALLLNELYTTKTQADLVVLSACETSLGKVEIGEGVMSLARGFLYSGSKSVVSSLWSINDKATTTIMTDFYRNLKNGKTKSKSLQQAKINYLKTHSLSEASPYYWASFVLIGDGGKVDFTTDYTIYYWLFGFLVLGCLVWMHWSFRRRNG